MNTEAIKDRLKNHAKKYNRTFQDELTMYGLERTIYRLSISKYVDNFILKGGIFLYALYGGKYARITSDIDLLRKNTSNTIENMRHIIEDIFSIHVEDGLVYEIDSISIKEITEFKDYHGLNVSAKAYLDRTRIDISIDIGFGDVVYPEKIKMKYPVLLDMAIPEIYAYSLESVIAEKFEAVVELGYGNSRYKDFYDIYILLNTYDFNGEILKQAIFATFENRQTTLLDIAAFEEDFNTDPVRQLRWTSFIKKKKAMQKIDFENLIQDIKSFLVPITKAIIEGEDFTLSWKHENKVWI